MNTNWREKVSEKFLYTKDEKLKNKKVTEIDDSKLLIKLGGIIEVANLRGFDKVEYDVVKAELDHVVVKCRVTWSANEHGPSQVFESIAGANRQNADDFWHNLLETCAENRAFVRAVRKYLGINIVGEDEIKREEKQPTVMADMPNPQNTLRSVMTNKGVVDIDSLKAILRKHYTAGKLDKAFADTVKTWNDISDIKPKECKIISGILQTE